MQVAAAALYGLVISGSLIAVLILAPARGFVRASHAITRLGSFHSHKQHSGIAAA